MKIVLPSDKDLTDQSREEKLEIARSVGRIISTDLSDEDRKVAEELANQLVRDSSMVVRKAFVSELKNSPFIPKDVAETIANDLKDVSAPFLLDTEELDQELMEYIALNCSEMAREILALRLNLPEPVSFAISEKGGEIAVTNLMGNDTAEVSTRVCLTLTDRFATNDMVLGGMAKRDDLPLAVIEVLVTKLSENLVEAMVDKYGLGEDFAAYIGGEAQFKTMQNAMKKASDGELRIYLKEQLAKGNLEGPVILQMLKTGDFRAYSRAISLRSSMTVNDAETLLRDGSTAAFHLMLQRASLNDKMAALFSSTYYEAKREIDAEATY